MKKNCVWRSLRRWNLAWGATSVRHRRSAHPRRKLLHLWCVAACDFVPRAAVGCQYTMGSARRPNSGTSVDEFHNGDMLDSIGLPGHPKSARLQWLWWGEAGLDLRDPRELERTLRRDAACLGFAGTDCDRLSGSEEFRGILDLLEPRRLRRFFGLSNSFLSTSPTSSLNDVSMLRTAHNMPPSLFCAPVMLDLVLVASYKRRPTLVIGLMLGGKELLRWVSSTSSIAATPTTS